MSRCAVSDPHLKQSLPGHKCEVCVCLWYVVVCFFSQVRFNTLQNETVIISFESCSGWWKIFQTFKCLVEAKVNSCVNALHHWVWRLTVTEYMLQKRWFEHDQSYVIGISVYLNQIQNHRKLCCICPDGQTVKWQNHQILIHNESCN